MKVWIDREQRRALAAWMLAGSGPALLFVITGIIVILAWVIKGEELTRVNWLGSLGLGLICLLAISLMTYGVDQALRTFKASGGGVTLEATGQNGDLKATVTDAAGDTATVSLSTSAVTQEEPAP